MAATAGELDQTMAADPGVAARPTLGVTRARTTVLPRRQPDGAPVPAENDRRFREVRALGAGGMGEVVLALDGDIHRKVAIKRLRAGTMSPAALLRFADEVRTVGQLEHPSIVPVHDVGVDDDGQVFLVMKYVEGETLEDVLNRLRVGDPEAVARYTLAVREEILTKILEALAYAHERGYVHRDLKPANVMIGPHGEVTLMDWGIAKRIGTVDAVDPTATTDEHNDRLVETSAGSILGTPMYMSPEQAAGRNQELDARSDVFSVSLLVVELFTLKHPLQKLEGLAPILATLLHHDLDTDKVFGGWFVEARAPIPLMWFAIDGLARDPANRYRDAGEMLRALRRARTGDGPLRCPITVAKAGVAAVDGFIDRRPSTFLVLCLFLSLSLLAGIGWGAVAVVRALLR